MTEIIVLIIAGLFLIIAEMILPGMIAGILGIICLLAAVIWTGSEYGMANALLLLAGELVLGFIVFVTWMKYFPRSGFGKKLSLHQSEKQRSSARDYADLLGQSGVTKTALRPSGVAIINGNRVDVVSEGSHIAIDAPVEVVKVEGSRIVVRGISPKE